jgi:hypothetical protein
MEIDNCVVCGKYLKHIGEKEQRMCNDCDNKTDAIAKEQDKALIIDDVSKSLKVDMQYFDSCDCPYQINTFIKKHNIDVNDIISFSENEDSITMYYKTF